MSETAAIDRPLEPTLPLDSFRDAAVLLRRPFTPAAVKFKVQAEWEKGALIVAYIDARLVVERLNKIIPHLWWDEYEPLGTKHLICRLTVDGITRQDVGEGVGKGLYSDALKRAAVKFGVGVSLYAIPKMILDFGPLLNKKPRGSIITDAGERRLRDLYERWLTAHGTQAFGEAFDHGDVADAQGDAEAPEGVNPETGEIESDIPSDVPGVITGERLAELRGWYRETGWNADELRMQLVATGSPDTSDVRRAMAALTPGQANGLATAMQERLLERQALAEAAAANGQSA